MIREQGIQGSTEQVGWCHWEQGAGRAWIIPCRHVFPDHPDLHSQRNPFVSSIHVPPGEQGIPEQSLMSTGENRILLGEQGDQTCRK